MRNYLNSRLAVRLFFSYLVVILVGMVVLSAAATFAVPGAFNRRMGEMSMMTGRRMGAMGFSRAELFTGFRAIFRDSLTLSIVSASLAAVLVSAVITRQVVAPIREIMKASQRIADGHYKERVRIRPGASGEGGDELAQLSFRFNQMAARLEQTEEFRRQLIADVAHEMRTPLTAIKGSLEGIMDGVLPGDEATCQSIYREAERLQRLVSDLQELSKVEAGAYSLDLKAEAVDSLARAVVSRLERQFEEKGVGIEVDLPDGLPPVLVDEDRMIQVLTNLVGNALQYTPAGGRVTISALQKDRELWLSVRDTGIGIPAEHLPRIFDRFYRIDKSRSRPGGGSGVGLTIARYLVEAHGGRIWAESAGLGEGSVFTFALPVSG